MVAIVVAAIGTGWYFYSHKHVLTDIDVVDKVGKLMILPGETATIATVTDVTKLNSQVFFKNAKNGDKVLIFTAAGKAILYRPGINKIIEVTAVLPADNSVPTSANNQLTNISVQKVDNQISLVLNNGTKTAGLTNKFEKKITGKFPNVVIKSKETAARQDYQQTIVVDISNRIGQLLNDLATFLEAKIVTLPEGEVKPEADILVIFGKSSVAP